MTKNKLGMLPEDVLKFKTISDPRISPDGKSIAFVLRVPGVEKYYTDIHVVDSEGRNQINLTNNGWSSKPRWSPKGDKIAYTSLLEGKQVLYIMAPDGTGTRELVQIQKGNYYYPRTGEDLAWSPDGKKVAYIGTDDKKNSIGDIIVVKDIQYKGLSSYSDGRRNHIFTVSPNGGKPEKITSGEFDEHTIFWSPDSSEIGFISNRTGKRDYNNDTLIYAVNVANRKIRKITDLKGTQYTPKWSPEGHHIAFAATTRWQTMKDSMSEDSHIWLIGEKGEDSLDLTAELDRRCSGPFWIDSESLIFTANHTGKNPIYRVSLDGNM